MTLTITSMAWPLNATHLAQFQHLAIAVVETTYTPLLDAPTVAVLLAMMDNPSMDAFAPRGKGQFFALLDGDTLVGSLITDTSNHNTCILMRTLNIHPSYQRQGWGRKMVQTAEQFHEQATEFVADIAQADDKADAFWRTMGYVPTSVRKLKLSETVLLPIRTRMKFPEHCI